LNHLRAIVFDYGNVLDIPDSWEQWHQQRDQAAAEVGLTAPELWDRLYNNNGPWMLVKTGQITEQTYWDKTLGPLGFRGASEQQAFLSRLFAGRDRIDPRMQAILRELRQQYRLAVLSNTHIVEMAQWLVEERGMQGIFKTVISSAQVGLAKPDPAIYWLLLERLGLIPAETLLIDDLPRNTKAAEALGMNTIVFTTPESLRNSLTTLGILLSDSQSS